MYVINFNLFNQTVAEYDIQTKIALLSVIKKCNLPEFV